MPVERAPGGEKRRLGFSQGEGERDEQVGRPRAPAECERRYTQAPALLVDKAQARPGKARRQGALAVGQIELVEHGEQARQELGEAAKPAAGGEAGRGGGGGHEDSDAASGAES
ncbi:MAG TPA: hypothetical protein VHA07_14280, partial [Devosia sp.]|nr:hypothetical protein [Devosia sp.]